MSDYIKREDVIKAVKHLSRNYTGKGKREDHPHIDFIIDEIKYEVPSADVAPVVRCKDCAKRGKNCLSGRISLYDDGFCSDGERKDNEIDRR